MKLNVACPFTGQQKKLEVEDAKTLSQLYEKRLAQEVAGEVLGEQFAGYVFRICGGCDKQGFPMKQGVLTQTRVRLLLKGKQTTCFNPKRNGMRKRKSVRGCIVGPDIAVLNLSIVKKGAGDIEGLTDKVLPRPLGPKRASKIRALFMLDKQDDVRKYVIRRKPDAPAEAKDGDDAPKAPRSKAPKIQRLVTQKRIARKRHELQHKRQRATKAKADAAEYHALLRRRAAEQRSKRATHLSKKRQERLSTLDDAAAAATTTTTTSSGKDAKKAAGKKAAAGGASAAAAAAAAATSSGKDAKKAAAGKKSGDKKASSGAAAAAAAAAATTTKKSSAGGKKKAAGKK